MKVSLAEGLLRITAQNPDLGEDKEDLPVPHEGDDFTIGFNARYLVDVLSVLETSEVRFELGDEHSPGVLHAPDDRTYVAVVMPMRV